MGLPLDRRTVHFYEIEMQSWTRSAVKSPATTTFPRMLACLDALKVSLPVEVSKRKLARTSLVDATYDATNGWYELLLNKADAAVSDVAFRDLNTAQTRKAGKTKTEGIEISSHVMVRPNSNGHTATVLLTMGAGVAVKDVAALLKMLSQRASRVPAHRELFYFDNPSGALDEHGDPEQYRVSYRFIPSAYKSQTLANALKSGQFEYMELIAHEDRDFDSGGNLKIEQQVVKVTAGLPAHVTGQGIVNAVRSYLKKPDAERFDTLRVRYKTPTGASTSTTLEIAGLENAFTQKETIRFSSEVEAQQNQLSQTVLNQMRKLMRSVAS